MLFECFKRGDASPKEQLKFPWQISSFVQAWNRFDCSGLMNGENNSNVVSQRPLAHIMKLICIFSESFLIFQLKMMVLKDDQRVKICHFLFLNKFGVTRSHVDEVYRFVTF